MSVMPTAFEDGDGTRDMPGDRWERGDEAEPPLVDLDGPEATGKILPNILYVLNRATPVDVAIDDYCQRPVVTITVGEGEQRLAYIVAVSLPSKGQEFASPDVLNVHETECIEARRVSAWKLAGARPYWICVGEFGASEDFVRQHWEHVLDVEFPGGRIPAIEEWTHGTRLCPVEDSGDMQQRPERALQQEREHGVRSLLQRVRDIVLRVLRGW